MVSVRVYVEGGGNPRSDSALRKGFCDFWRKSGLKGKVKMIACGAGSIAFDDFCLALETHKNDTSILLLDSEAAFDRTQAKWSFLSQQGDAWKNGKPARAKEEQIYFMVQCMEAWLLADRATLQKYYGKDFHPNALPSEHRSPDTISPKDLRAALANATRKTSKGSYSKGKHAFELIGLIDPQMVMAACPSAKHLIDYLLHIS
jgi:hypothetical protein